MFQMFVFKKRVILFTMIKFELNIVYNLKSSTLIIVIITPWTILKIFSRNSFWIWINSRFSFLIQNFHVYVIFCVKFVLSLSRINLKTFCVEKLLLLLTNHWQIWQREAFKSLNSNNVKCNVCLIFHVEKRRTSWTFFESLLSYAELITQSLCCYYYSTWVSNVMKTLIWKMIVSKLRLIFFFINMLCSFITTTNNILFWICNILWKRSIRLSIVALFDVQIRTQK